MSTKQQRADAGALPLGRWEADVAGAVGDFIEFWGFKRNDGRVWALLYLRGKAMTAVELQRTLSLSKGAVSMIVRELERWGVVHRVRPGDSSTWHYAAETNLMAMLGRVLREREASIISRVKLELEAAERDARADQDASAEARERVTRLRNAATLAESMISLFLRTAQLDASNAADVLQRKARARKERKR